MEPTFTLVRVWSEEQEQAERPMDGKVFGQLSEAVTALRANGFETLTEAAIFCAAASATVNGKLSAVTEISRAVKLPNSTVSRLVWILSQRGYLEYVRDARDRRIRRVRAVLAAFK